MANKWRDEVGEENLRLVQKVIDDSIIANSVNVEILSDDGATEPISSYIENQRVIKLTGGENEGTEVTIILNENIFDFLPQDFKILAIEEAIHAIHRNKADKVVKDNEDVFTSYLGFLKKVGTEKFVVLVESIRSAKRAFDEGNIPDKRQTSFTFEEEVDKQVDAFKKNMQDIVDVPDSGVDKIEISTVDNESKELITDFEKGDDK